jgi:hypothetical protein
MSAPSADPDLFTPSPSAVRAWTSDGELVIWQERPGLVAQIGRGVFSLPFAHRVMQFYDPIVATGVRLRVFADFERLTQYTREARDILTAHSLRNRELLEGVHMLLSSKMVALGVSSFKHDMGVPLVHTYADRASFLRSYADAIRGSG